MRIIVLKSIIMVCFPKRYTLPLPNLWPKCKNNGFSAPVWRKVSGWRKLRRLWRLRGVGSGRGRHEKIRGDQIGRSQESIRFRKTAGWFHIYIYVYEYNIHIYICICFICVIQSYNWDDPNAQILEVESTQVWMFIAVVYGSAWFLMFKFVYVWMFMDVYGCSWLFVDVCGCLWVWRVISTL